MSRLIRYHDNSFLRPTGQSTISGSDGTSLHFENREESAAYEADIEEVVMRHYHKLRAKYGIWASTQNKYVTSPEMLHEYDSRIMERRYAAWLAKQPKDLP